MALKPAKSICTCFCDFERFFKRFNLICKGMKLRKYVEDLIFAFPIRFLVTLWFKLWFVFDSYFSGLTTRAWRRRPDDDGLTMTVWHQKPDNCLTATDNDSATTTAWRRRSDKHNLTTTSEPNDHLTTTVWQHYSLTTTTKQWPNENGQQWCDDDCLKNTAWWQQQWWPDDDRLTTTWRRQHDGNGLTIKWRRQPEDDDLTTTAWQGLRKLYHQLFKVRS